MAEKETRNFALRNKDGNKISVFTGKQASQAALKAANRGALDDPLEEAVFSMLVEMIREQDYINWSTRLIISFSH
jgi:hypothetical protein